MVAWPQNPVSVSIPWSTTQAFSRLVGNLQVECSKLTHSFDTIFVCLFVWRNSRQHLFFLALFSSFMIVEFVSWSDISTRLFHCLNDWPKEEKNGHAIMCMQYVSITWSMKWTPQTHLGPLNAFPNLTFNVVYFTSSSAWLERENYMHMTELPFSSFGCSSMLRSFRRWNKCVDSKYVRSRCAFNDYQRCSKNKFCQKLQ